MDKKILITLVRIQDLLIAIHARTIISVLILVVIALCVVGLKSKSNMVPVSESEIEFESDIEFENTPASVVDQQKDVAKTKQPKKKKELNFNIPSANKKNKKELSEIDAEPHVRDFIMRYYDVARKVAARYKVNAAIMMAQAMKESGYGKSELATKANNLFGLKEKNEELTSIERKLIQGSYSILTREYKKGKMVKVVDEFYAYKNTEDSFEHFGEWLRKRIDTNERYLAFKNADPSSATSWAAALGSSPYSTDPSYAKSVMDIVKRYKLDDIF